MKRAKRITSGDGPAFDRGLADLGYSEIEELSRRCEEGPVMAQVFQHEDGGDMMVLLTLGEDHYLFKQVNIAPIFDSGDDEAKYHNKNPHFAF